ncbi:MAG: two-component sensor histidine kinase, partial [Magnetospirillum sp.]|nr:two-component sensor histidine kinase [Magnetospirillum sp.]
GAALGYAAATVDVAYFERFYRALDVGPNPAMGVYMLDGSVLVRQPLKPEDVGANLAANPIYGHLATAPYGTYRGRSGYDGTTRVVSYRSDETRRLLVWVGIGADEALGQWRARALRTAALAVAGLAAMAVLLTLLAREFAGQRCARGQLEAVNRRLARSNADLEQFAYIASHDLKEPLRSIGSYVQLLQKRYQGRLDADADAFIGYAVDGVRRMQAIIAELLAYSRVGIGDLTLAPVQSGAAVSAALGNLKVAIAEAQATVSVERPLPMVIGDQVLLISLFQNLIGNGIKYRRPDIRAAITVGCQDRGTEWAFYVADNGIGIEPEYHRQVFEVFKRLHPSDRYPGTGVGLAICQRVVERHGGRIWVESTPGKGATLWFTLAKQP